MSDFSLLLTHGLQRIDANQSGSYYLVNVDFSDAFYGLSDKKIYTPYYHQAEKWINVGAEILPHILTEQKNAQKFDYALCSLTKQKLSAQYDLAQAYTALNNDGILMAVAANNAGGKRLTQWFEALELEHIQSYSKYKAKVVWGTKPQQSLDSATAQEWLSAGKMQRKILPDEKPYTTQAGLFGWDKIDGGSHLLIQEIQNNFAHNMTGDIGDFGCGYGYLSTQLVAACPHIKSMHLIDIDRRALQCAQDNIKGFLGDVHLYWADLTRPAITDLPLLDHIVMNPPFHDDKKTAYSIGQACIQSAYDALKIGGGLYMVANAHLPYEKFIEGLFRQSAKICEKTGFKIFYAIK